MLIVQPTVQGSTGQRLLSMLATTAADYQGTVNLPTAEQAEGWVISHTSGPGQHNGTWILANLEAVRRAPRRCPANAEGASQFRYSKNYHPSLAALREIAAIIRGDNP